MNVKIRKEYLLPYVGFALMEVGTWLLVVVDSEMFYYSKLLAVSILIFSLLFQKWTIKLLLSKALVVAISLVSYYYSKDDIILYFAVALLAFHNTKLSVLLKIDLIVKCICMTIVIALYCMKAVPNNDIVTLERIRYSLGYFNPNGVFFGIYILCLDILFIYGNELKIKHYLIIAIIGFIFGELTYCRTGIILLTLSVIMFFVERHTTVLNNKIIRKLLIGCVPILYLLSVFFSKAFSFTNPFFMAIDTMLTGRIHYAADFLNRYGFSLLGQQIHVVTGLEAELISQRAYSLDNFFVYSLISYGIVFSAMIIVLSVKSMENYSTENRQKECIVLFLLAIYSLCEKVYISFEANLFIVLLCAAWKPTRVRNRKRK